MSAAGKLVLLAVLSSCGVSPSPEDQVSRLPRHAHVSEARYRSSVLRGLLPPEDGTYGHYCTIWPYEECLVYNDWCFVDCAPNPGYCKISSNSDPSDPHAVGSCVNDYPQ